MSSTPFSAVISKLIEASARICVFSNELQNTRLTLAPLRALMHHVLQETAARAR